MIRAGSALRGSHTSLMLHQRTRPTAISCLGSKDLGLLVHLLHFLRVRPAPFLVASAMFVVDLKTLFRQAVERGKLDANPTKGIKLFKEMPKTPRLLEIEEVGRLLEVCRDEPCPVDLYALVCCMVFAGLRKAEVSTSSPPPPHRPTIIQSVD